MVYITGDMHGDRSRLSPRALRALRRDDILLICGDFGFIWDGSAAEKRLLAKLARRKYTIAFLDGRHENFDLLAEYPVREWNGGRAHIINDRVIHLMRGEIYELEGERYFAFGGGESDDREFRQSGKTWWQQEMPTEEEMRRALDNLAACDNRVDYILTHVPSAKSCMRLAAHAGEDGVSLFLNRIEETVTCRRWFFGSLHKDRAISAQRQAVFETVIPVKTPPSAG